ncbi:MAG: hypothetical protein ACK5PB_23720 [Pirellula sp.]|jgi:hypothetical protein
MDNPYSSPVAFDQTLEPSAGNRHYGGIGRLAYLGIAIGLGIAQNVVLGLLARDEALQSLSLGGIIVFLILSLIPVYYRLMNIGMNPWWCLLMMVPIANLFIGIRCLVCQEGYEDTKKLDTAGKIVTFIVVGLFLLVIAIAILSVTLG